MNTKLLADKAMDDAEHDELLSKILMITMPERMGGLKSHHPSESRRSIDCHMEEMRLREQIQDPLFDGGTTSLQVGC